MYKVTTLTTVLITLAIISSTPAQAASCKSKVYATGSKALTWAGARVRAKAKWRAKAIGTYGAAYGSWLLARNKSLNCWKSGIRKRCKAGARPCRPL